MKRTFLALLFFSSSALAHEIGTARVRAVFHRDHTYRIEVTTAPRSLLNKLEAAAGMPRSPQLPLPMIRLKLQQLAPELQRHASIDFLRGARATSAASSVRIFGDDYAVTVRFTGDIPRDAREFVWRYDLAYSTYALTLQNEGDAEARQWIEGGERSAPFALSSEVVPIRRADVAAQYLKLGYLHIVPYGIDHVLFVLGLFLLTTRARPLLTQITAFTIAHSITLGLTMYGVMSLPSSVVEPAIALSIAYVAIENLTTSELRPWRVAIVFAFGLLHGMGFAGVLRELGLPGSEIATALVTFNLGVEAGQLSVVATAFALFAAWHRTKPWYRPRFVVPASALIAATGVFWTVQRMVT